MRRPPFETFKRPTCRGCYAFGTACGQCEKCAWERAGMSKPTAMELQPHQQRVVLEKTDLEEKISKLAAFLPTPLYASLDPAERIRLTAQIYVMRQYSDILTERIKAFSQ